MTTNALYGNVDFSCFSIWSTQPLIMFSLWIPFRYDNWFIKVDDKRSIILAIGFDLPIQTPVIILINKKPIFYLLGLALAFDPGELFACLLLARLLPLHTSCVTLQQPCTLQRAYGHWIVNAQGPSHGQCNCPRLTYQHCHKKQIHKNRVKVQSNFWDLKFF